MRRRVVITGMGAITPLGHSVEDTVPGAARGPQRRRADHALQRPAVSRRSSPPRSRTSTWRAFVRDPQRWADSGVNSQFRRRRRPAGAGRRRPARRRPRGSHALRRLPRLRRRHSGFPQPDLADRARAISREQPDRGRRPSSAAGCSSSTPAASPNRSCTPRRPIWPPTSTCKGPTTTA